jgi:hypothetical protein
MRPKDILKEARAVLSDWEEKPEAKKSVEKSTGKEVKREGKKVFKKEADSKKDGKIDLEMKKTAKRPNIDFRVLDQVSKILSSLVPKKDESQKTGVKGKLSSDDMEKIKLLKIQEQKAKNHLMKLKKMEDYYDKESYTKLISEAENDIGKIKGDIKNISIGQLKT